MIYFIRSGAEGPIKIGTCKDGTLARRLSSLQTGNPTVFSVLGVMDGDGEFESDLHTRFRSHRHAGEWFAPVPDILTFVRDHGRPFEKRRKPVRYGPVDAAIEFLGGPSKASAALTASTTS